MTRSELINTIVDGWKDKEDVKEGTHRGAAAVLASVGATDPQLARFLTAQEESSEAASNEGRKLWVAELMVSDFSDNDLEVIANFIMSPVGMAYGKLRREVRDQLFNMMIRAHTKIGMAFAEMQATRIYQMMLNATRTLRPSITFPQANELVMDIMNSNPVIRMSPEAEKFAMAESMQTWNDAGVHLERRTKLAIPREFVEYIQRTDPTQQGTDICNVPSRIAERIELENR